MGQKEDYGAFVTGGEYTLYSVFNSTKIALLDAITRSGYKITSECIIIYNMIKKVNNYSFSVTSLDTLSALTLRWSGIVLEAFICIRNF